MVRGQDKDGAQDCCPQFAQSHADGRRRDILKAAGPRDRPNWNRYAYALNNPLRLIDPSGLIDQSTEGQKPNPQSDQAPPPPEQQKPISLPEDVIDIIRQSFGPGTYQTEDGEITVTDSTAAVQDAVTAATEVYNTAYSIGADYNALVNNGVLPDTAVTTTSSRQTTSPGAEVKGAELTIKTPQQQLSTQQTITQPRTLESRMGALDSQMTQMTPRVAENIAARPLAVREKDGTEHCGPQHFVRSYAQERMKAILDTAKARGTLDAMANKPIQVELKR